MWYQNPSFLSKGLIIISLIIVTLSLGAFLTIDVLNVAGTRDFLINIDHRPFFFPYQPFTFYHFGRSNGIAEIIQWSILALGIGISFFQAGKWSEKETSRSQFFLIFGLTFLIMLLEDAGDIRHTLMSYVQVVANEPDQGIFGTIFEALYFVGIGFLPAWALFQYRSLLRRIPRAFTYLIIGVFLRYLAGSLSLIGTAFDMFLEHNLYTLWGKQMVQLSYSLGGTELQILWTDTWSEDHIAFSLLDSLIEENIEIIAYACMVAGIMYFLNKKPTTISSQTPDN